MPLIPLMPIFLLWIGLIALTLLLFACGAPPFHFLSSQELLLCTEELKTFFLILLLPLLVKPARTTEAKLNNPALDFYAFNLRQIIMFLLLILPLSIFCAAIAGVPYTHLGLLHLFYLVISVAIVKIRWHEASTGTPLMRFYYLIVFTLGMAIPLFYYLRLELFGKKTPLLLYLNPFWLTWRMLYP